LGRPDAPIDRRARQRRRQGGRRDPGGVEKPIVTFENQDDLPHSIVATDKSIKPKALDTDDKFTVAFTKAGEIDYFCGLHPHMTGKIIVTP
jgi:hypothetical protein